MEYKYKATPMARRPLNTNQIMIRLLIGLLIVYGYGLYNASKWGKEYLINGILLFVVSIVVGTITEAIFALACKKNPIQHLKKSFHYITCIILVLTVPANCSLFVMGIATFLALFFGKLVYGGFGQNVFNPAAVGRAIIATSFAGKVALDAVTSPTVTTAFANMNWISDSTNYLALMEEYGGLGTILSGSYFGALGETCTILILAIGVLYAIFDVIDWRIPLTYLGILFAGSMLIGLSYGLGIDYAIAFVSTGGVAFGGVFMLTDPVTNPQTRPGKILFAAIAAMLTILIRFLGNLPEGVIFSILIVNMLAPAIDYLFVSKQIESQKRNIAIVFGSIIMFVLITALIGKIVKPGTFIINDNSDISEETGASEVTGASEIAGPLSLSGDYSSNNATVTSVDGDTYHVTTDGYHNKNEFDVVVKNGSVVSVVCTSFGDTEGVGDSAIKEEYLKNYEGATLFSSIDACTGATYTSKSVMAAVQAALKEAYK